MADQKRDDNVSRKRRIGSIKLKGLPLKIAKLGNWKDGAIGDKKSKTAEPLTPPRLPMINSLEWHSETFSTGRPMEDAPDLQACKHCKKSVLKNAIKDHIAQCLRVKKEKAQRKKEAREARERAREAARQEKAEEEGEGRPDDEADEKGTAGKTSKKAAGKKLDGDTKGKKRKADGDADKGPKSKKKKEDPKPKVPKTKGPVDVERQCGVPLANGQPCARSLTCKSHSMGAKRAVAGRSAPYDMLLAAYQKKNQAKQQKAALDANAPLEDEEDANNGPIDEEEEALTVMTALKTWQPVPPVPQKTFAPLKFEYKDARLRELLDNATNGGRTNIFKVNGFGAQKLPEGHHSFFGGLNGIDEDAPGEPDNVPIPASMIQRRSSSISMQGPPQRRPSVTGRA